MQTNEPVNDIAIPLDREVNVIAAVGPLNSRMEANAHSHNGQDATVDDVRIDFSSKDEHSCTSSLYDRKEEEVKIKPWPTRVLSGENTITVRIGPTGGKRGYTAITGKPSWGIAWYLNDLLIPELYVERGQTYTFLVEGGDDHTQPARYRLLKLMFLNELNDQPLFRYHPFYISDSDEGGFGQKSQAKQHRQTIYAGVEYDSEQYPRATAAGRYCEWQHMTIDKSADIETFEDYKKTLRLECESGETAVLNWTVALDTPPIVYYQVRLIELN